MGCCDSDSVQVSKMALELKSGPMLWHKRRFFGSNWRDVHTVLYNDSSLLWYRDKSRQEQEGGVVLKDAPELIAFGTYTSQVPGRPSLPEHYEAKELLAFGVRGKDVVFWLLCPNQEEVASWMAGITTSLPPPPAPPQIQQSATAPLMGPPQPQEFEYQPQEPTPQYQQPTPQYQPPPNQPQMPSYTQQPPGGIPGQYPAPMHYRPPVYQAQNAVAPQPYGSYPTPNSGGGPTTVVVQQERPANSFMSGGAGNFAMGMLVGGAIGTAWGSHHQGFGFGGGWGGGGAHAPSVQDTNININNYYDNDTTTVNNNLDMTNNTSTIEQAASVQQPAIMAEEYAPIEAATEYIPVEEAGGGMYDGGYYDGGGGYDGGDFGGDDFGGGDFGGGDF